MQPVMSFASALGVAGFVALRAGIPEHRDSPQDDQSEHNEHDDEHLRLVRGSPT